jgi:hypothetical protein
VHIHFNVNVECCCKDADDQFVGNVKGIVAVTGTETETEIEIETEAGMEIVVEIIRERKKHIQNHREYVYWS